MQTIEVNGHRVRIGLMPTPDEQREIEDAIWTLQTYGRGRIVENSIVGPWIQIDHDREHVDKLVRAADLLERFGMLDRHPSKGNPRNVRVRK